MNSKYFSLKNDPKNLTCSRIWSLKELKGTGENLAVQKTSSEDLKIGHKWWPGLILSSVLGEFHPMASGAWFFPT